MKPSSVPMSLAMLLHLGGAAMAQEPTPSPAPTKAPPPTLRVPALPTTPVSPAPVSGATGTRPTAPRSGDGSPAPSSPLSAATPARPAVPAFPRRLPDAALPAASGPGRPRLSLEAISVINGRPAASINGRRVAPGDVIEGARVIRILEHQVELEYQGRRFAIGF